MIDSVQFHFMEFQWKRSLLKMISDPHWNAGT
jgi:hypothetical protein